MRLRITAVLATFVFAAGACGGPGPGASSVPSPGPSAPATIGKACDLLTDAEIGALTGSTVVSKTDNVQDTVYANHCRWTLQRADGGGTGEVDLGVLSPGGRERYDHSGGTNGLEPVEGLPADDAGTDSNTGSLFAVRGDTMIDIFALGLGLSTEEKVELARTVLEHLFGGGGPSATPAGGEATPVTGGTVSDPCTLLTDAEIEDVVGAFPTGHSSTPRGGLWDADCVWEVPGAGTLPATVTVTLKSPGGAKNWDQYMAPFTGEFTAVAGLGDAAFEKVHWPTHVLIGDAYVSVQFSDFPDPEDATSTDLARLVVGHLGG